MRKARFVGGPWGRLAISCCGKELEGFVTFVMLDRRVLLNPGYAQKPGGEGLAQKRVAEKRVAKKRLLRRLSASQRLLCRLSAQRLAYVPLYEESRGSPGHSRER